MKGNDTNIVSKRNYIFDKVNFQGGFLLTHVKLNWFSSIREDIGQASMEAFHLCYNESAYSSSFITISIDRGDYNLYTPIILGSRAKLDLNASTIYVLNNNIPAVDSYSYINGGTANSYIVLKNGTFIVEGQHDNYYTIDISNTWRVTIDNITITYSEFRDINSKVGIGLGRKTNDAPSSTSTFVQKVINCNIPKIYIYKGCTDNYISRNEIWATNTDCAIEVHAGSCIITDNQIVGGRVYGGIYIPEVVTGLKISNNYFDGSYFNVDSLDGIYAINLRNSIISNNNFWFQKRHGINSVSMHACTICNNVFDDNDARGEGYADIKGQYNGCVISGNVFNREYYYKDSKLVYRDTKDTEDFKRGRPIDCYTTVTKSTNSLIISNNNVRCRKESAYGDSVYIPCHYANANSILVINNGSVLFNNNIANRKNTFDSNTQFIDIYPSFFSSDKLLKSPIIPYNDDSNKYINSNPINGAMRLFFWYRVVRPEWYVNGKWVDADGNSGGNIYYAQNTPNRPALDGVRDGFNYFDWQIMSAIWKISDSWVDAFGNKPAIHTGTKDDRPTDVSTGHIYFDTTLNKPIYWSGTKWVDSEGNNLDSTSATSGTFANKPTGVDIGYAYFCTDKQTTEGATNGIMIYYKGSNTWVDALGRVVS